MKVTSVCMHAQLCQTLCNPTDLTQGPLFMEFPRQDWRGLLFHSPGDLPDPGIEPRSPASPALAGRFYTSSAIRKSDCFTPTKP